jgi:hypothetical protein
MTKKDYELIAKVLKDTHNSFWSKSTAHNFYQALISNFTAALSKENPRFNADTFKKACI